MNEQPQAMDVFLDLLPNLPKNDQNRAHIEQLLRQRFEDTLPNAVERVWDLPPMIVKPDGEYLTMLLEARKLYLNGHFYSCVAMCGIVGERIIKDVFRTSVLIHKGGSPQSPPDSAFNQLERIEVNGIIRFLKESVILNTEAAKAADSLGQLRNQYAHARGPSPQPDALKAIKLLHNLMEDTVSVFKEFEIRDGTFVRKTTL